MDRIDLHVEVLSLSTDELTSAPLGETSAVIRERVVKASKIQEEHYRSHPEIQA